MSKLYLQLSPILATLRRHKIAAFLIVLEIALSCAIICNAAFLMNRRLAVMSAPTGMADAELLSISVSSIGRDERADARTAADLALLRAIPGVRSAAVVNQLPLGGNSDNGGIRLLPQADAPTTHVAWYLFGQDALQTMGLRVVEGRDFLPEEYLSISAGRQDISVKPPAVLINQALARKLFPNQSAVGQRIYVDGAHPLPIVGVVDELMRARPEDLARRGPGSLISPRWPSYDSGVYLLRVPPQLHAQVQQAAAATLKLGGDRRVIGKATRYEDLRAAYFRQDRYMMWIMGVVCLALLMVTALGIVGLASFWVQQRSRMFGTRRALGATQGQVRAYFQLENAVLTIMGLGLGVVGAYGINLLLMHYYESPRLPVVYVPWAALALLILGQLAVLVPARRAASLPPVLVMRGA